MLFSLSEQPGQQIGAYRLIEPLGEGGFGVVWRAEQTGPLRREVALKVLKLGMDTRQVIARFEAERQALALMSHPGIAAVYDAGATDTGRPYFVMELVRGAPLTTFCDERRLELRERVALFRQVCLAVEHAHQRGVVHRDLKPSNVLVADGPQGPQPKVIDFGIAKATGARLTDSTQLTEQRQMLGTPDYMAPEQALAGPQDLDARADVYSLGVMLYELLSGARPFDLAALGAEDYGEMLRTIREVDPPRPSTRVTTGDFHSTRAAQARSTLVRELERTLRGELDWIVMRALEKERERRYPSAQALADDLQRFLDSRPVEATPPSALYRARKFAVRNRVLVGAAGAVFVALGAGLAFATYGLIEARRESELKEQQRARAVEAEREQSRLRAEAEQALAQAESRRQEAEAARAEALRSAELAQEEADHRTRVADFFSEMLGGVGPFVAQGRDTSLLRSILDETLQRLEEDDASVDEHTQYTLFSVIGEVYVQLGEFATAERLYRRTIELVQRNSRASPDFVAAAWNRLGVALFQQSRLAEAADAFERAGEEFARLENQPADARDVLANLAAVWTQLGEYERAFEVYERILALARSASVVDKEHLAMQLSNYGAALRGVGKSRRAAECFAESLQLMEALGERTPNLVRVMMNLAATRRQLGEHDAAIELLERALPLAREISGPEHPDVATCLVNLGAARFYAGQREAGEELFRGALELRRKIYGELHPELGRPYEWLAQCARARGERDAACEFARRACDALTSAFERTHPEVLSIRAYHGRLLAEAGRGEQAVALLEANFAAVREVGVRSPQYDVALDAYVFALGVAGRWEDALTAAENSYAELERELAVEDPGRAARLAARAAALVKFCASWAAAAPASRASEVQARWSALTAQQG